MRNSTNTISMKCLMLRSELQAKNRIKSCEKIYRISVQRILVRIHAGRAPGSYVYMQEQCEAHEEMLHRLNRRPRTLSQCNSTCFQAESEQELLQSICEILVVGGECRLAWIGYCEHDAEQTVRPVA